MPENELKYLPVKDIVPSSWNPQAMKDAEFNLLCDEIAKNGFLAPIQVTPLPDGKFRILGGEHRWRAAQVNQLQSIPCMILREKKWEDEDLCKFVTVRLNTISGKLDPEKFLKLYEEMAQKYGKAELQTLFGYTDSHAFQKVVGDVKKGMKKNLPKELQAEFEELSKEATTVEDLSKIIQALFVKYGDTLEQNFMVFTHGKQEHIYVSMDKPTKKAMDKVLQYVKLTGKNINDVMAPMIQGMMKTLERRLEDGEDALAASDDNAASEDPLE